MKRKLSFLSGLTVFAYFFFIFSSVTFASEDTHSHDTATLEEATSQLQEVVPANTDEYVHEKEVSQPIEEAVDTEQPVEPVEEHVHEKVPADNTAEPVGEQHPADTTEEHVHEEVPADNTAELVGEQHPADTTDEHVHEEIPADNTAEPVGEQHPADTTDEHVHEEIPAYNTTEPIGEEQPTDSTDEHTVIDQPTEKECKHNHDKEVCKLECAKDVDKECNLDQANETTDKACKQIAEDEDTGTVDEHTDEQAPADNTAEPVGEEQPADSTDEHVHEEVPADNSTDPVVEEQPTDSTDEHTGDNSGTPVEETTHENDQNVDFSKIVPTNDSIFIVDNTQSAIETNNNIYFNKENLNQSKQLYPNMKVLVKYADLEVMIPGSILPENQNSGLSVQIDANQYEGALSKVYNFSIPTEDEKLIDTFATPIIITFKIDPTKVSNWDNIKVIYIDETGTKTLEEIKIVSIDKINGLISAEVTHFSKYGVFEIAGEPSQQVPTNEVTVIPTNTTSSTTSVVPAATAPAINDTTIESQLPNTASAMYNNFSLGLIMIALGGAILLIRRNKRNRIINSH
ncbi:LPXTG cell wall anchor domain-containing protein [Bacillus sp. DNRA2]|uniref:LPXTG cell wall anchor domain-containing protein n=1 Tax=Bacillus sp. DNRA2 TaxID=2723053 RepID=UPI00145DD07F|nr:LPXTG cell wall anchor domain-containing protein [Bacillus sp. DNRA2]NMD72665.1 LPXTG cell wall anchor domain-containing protein [Bacillus sp. DNRA2]